MIEFPRRPASKHWLFNIYQRHKIVSVALIATLLTIIYWSFIASNRYISEAHILLQKAEIAGSVSMDFSSLLTGTSSEDAADQKLLCDYLLSVDILKKLDAKLNLRAHYSDKEHDIVSRMWDENQPLEWFYYHYLNRVSVDYDETLGIIFIKAQAYDPQTAQMIASFLVEEGERKMNEMGHRLAQDQVSFLEKQVNDISKQLQKARVELISFQNEKGLLSPESTATNLAGVINQLEAQRVELQARRNSLLGYLSADAPGIVELDLQLKAIEKQIAKEQSKLTAPQGKTLNTTIEEFQRLQMQVEFIQDIYKTALVALEQGRMDATRSLKKVSVLQNPTLPEYSMEPRRVYNCVVSIFLALLITGILKLVAAVIEEHLD